ncbi:MAG: hypothetical protein K0S56_3754 [Microvirga sp.]|nr:hypothetical protein [Microvirga sp.]
MRARRARYAETAEFHIRLFTPKGRGADADLSNAYSFRVLASLPGLMRLRQSQAHSACPRALMGNNIHVNKKGYSDFP